MVMKRAEVLHSRLKQRWQQLIESEMDSDDFWEEVCAALGRESVEYLTEADLRLAHSYIRTARQWLLRMPPPTLLS